MESLGICTLEIIFTIVTLIVDIKIYATQYFNWIGSVLEVNERAKHLQGSYNEDRDPVFRNSHNEKTRDNR